MTALAYTLVGVLLVAGLALGAAIVAGLWFAMSGARPELLTKRRSETETRPAGLPD